jgi:hypothetical protein
MGLYRLELYDRYGNFLFDISDKVGKRRWVRSRNAYEELEWTIPLSEFNGLCGDNGKSPKEVMKRHVTQVVLRRGDHKRLRTFVLDFDVDVVNNSIQVTCPGMLAKFDRRIVTDYFQESINPALAAKQLIDASQLKPNGNLYLTTLTPANAPTRQVTFNDNRISDAVLSLANDGDKGFDFEFTVDNEFRTVLNMGSDRTNLVLQYGSPNAVIDGLVISHRGSLMANEITAKGSGSGETEEVIRAVKQNDVSQTEYGLLQKTITPNDVTETPTLERHAVSELEVAKDGLEIQVITVRNDPVISLDRIDIGDRFRLIIPGSGLESINQVVRLEKFECTITPEDEEVLKLYVSK